MITRDELEAQYPYLSRWDLQPNPDLPLRHPVAEQNPMGIREARVVGWVTRWAEGGVVFDVGGGDTLLLTARDVRSACRRLPDPTPCPITVPLELRQWEGSPVRPQPQWASWPGGYGRQLTGPGGVPAITLHPPRDGETFGRWTWEGADPS